TRPNLQAWRCSSRPTSAIEWLAMAFAQPLDQLDEPSVAPKPVGTAQRHRFLGSVKEHRQDVIGMFEEDLVRRLPPPATRLVLHECAHQLGTDIRQLATLQIG